MNLRSMTLNASTKLLVGQNEAIQTNSRMASSFLDTKERLRNKQRQAEDGQEKVMADNSKTRLLRRADSPVSGTSTVGCEVQSTFRRNESDFLG